jgi:hypothetical protein
MTRRWEVIAELVRKHGLLVGAEIGVAEGRFAAGLLSLCPTVRLWGFDTYEPGYRTWMGTSWTAEQQRRNEASARAWEAHFAPRMTLVRKSSLQAASWLEPASLDFVFIDADHDHEAVAADIAAWRTRLKPGGWMTGHDYDELKFPGVVAAVDEAFPDATKGADFTWMVQL